MGRVSKAQAARNRERVVAAACRLFRMHGVECVSLADVMSETGLTPGGFYKQFESKEALVDEAFVLAFEQASQSWDDIRDANDDGAFQALGALVEHYFDDRPAEQNCPMLSFSSAVSGLPVGSRIGRVYRAGVEELFRRFRDAARGSAGQETPTLSDDDAMVLFSAMIGTALITKAIGHTAWTDQMQAAVRAALPDSDSHS